jgi:hypothetical protein
MTDITTLQKQAGVIRQKLADAEDQAAGLNSRLRSAQNQLDRALRLGPAGAQPAAALQSQGQRFQAQVDQTQKAVDALKQDLAGLLQAVPEQPWDLVEQLGDGLPFLLLPVRIEARYMTVATGPELWVRIFPDTIAVHTHEKDLSAAEWKDGQVFWRGMWAANQTADESSRQKLGQAAWVPLARAYGSPRAAWIANATRPASLDVPSASALVFPPVDPQALKPSSWSRAPRAQVMPDCFVVMGYRGGRQIFRQAGAPVPNPLILGPDPLKAEAEYAQENGELKTGPDFAWIFDFNEAISKGMAVRVPLDSVTANRGLDRLVVLGLRLSADAAQGQALLEELLDNHHYSPGGLSLLPQGTPTNNTDGKSSPYSSAGPDPAESFATELGRAAFDPTAQPAEKTDAQRLAEALGVNYAPFQRLAHADQRDWREAQVMNTALFPVTGGYYLEEMLNLSLPTVADVRDFFTANVTGRSPLPAIRVGSQPYGVLLSSDFNAWKWSDSELSTDFLNQLLAIIQIFRQTWQSRSASAARVGASADPYLDLISVLGLAPASLEFYRRRGLGRDALWNFLAFRPGPFKGSDLMQTIQQQALALWQELGQANTQPPFLFHLAFFLNQDPVRDPLVDDIAEGETEKLSETRLLKESYRLPDPANPDVPLLGSYIQWLATASYQDLKRESLQDKDGANQPTPRPLLYRLLRSALLLALYDAATRLYARAHVLPIAIRPEIELTNVGIDTANPDALTITRTITRWEMLDAEIDKVLPALSTEPQPVGAWLLSPTGLKRPEAQNVVSVLNALQGLAQLPTARLERVFAEHLDLCSYRLDAWQTACFAKRLDALRAQPGTPEAPPDSLRQKGIYLGAYGWLEDLRPAPPLQKADTTGIPASLHDPQADGDLFEQPENGGFIHAPSLNHAVAAAVLRSAYLTHFDPQNPGKMAVNLSSARVRTALEFLEGVRNGQELGSLLGYQFERGLHDRYNDLTLNQFIANFRAKYPLIADKITPDPSGSPIETKEARNVLDGYALAEAAILREPKLPYPYDVPGLPPDPNSPQAASIQKEVTRLGDSLDAVADLLLAESVYHLAQGNFERSGASLQTLAEGGMPPDPEIAKTPRSGAAIQQRVTLHLNPMAAAGFWPGTPTQRARVEPGLNRWLGERLPAPARITFQVSLGGNAPVEQNLSGLGLQLVDLVLLTGDELSGQETELEKRLAYQIRRAQNNDSLEIKFEFMAKPASLGAFNLFELLPLLKCLRGLVATARPLSAIDLSLLSEVHTDPAKNLNPQGYDLSDLNTRLQSASSQFDAAVTALATAVPVDAQQKPVLSSIHPDVVHSALLGLGNFGLPDAVPVSAAGDTTAIRQSLAEQGLRVLNAARQRQGTAGAALARAANTNQSAEQRFRGYRAAAQAIFGPSFHLIPRFHPANGVELQAAAAFRDLPPGQGLTRFHKDNPLLVDEWLQGAARVRPGLANLEQILILSELFARPSAALKPLQLPFRGGDHWVAVEYPPAQAGGFSPQGEFVSFVQVLPGGSFDPAAAQSGLLVDEWSEVIPGESETTGIAVHYNQPNSHPPQTLLLAVTPEITGKWTWDKLAGILNDTLERAKQRAVEPDQLERTAFGQLLPAVISAISSRPFGTISTDLVYKTASLKLPPF